MKSVLPLAMALAVAASRAIAVDSFPHSASHVIVTRANSPSTTGALQKGLLGETLSIFVPTPGIPTDVDVFGDYFYWTESDTFSVRRAKLDGSGQETLFTGSSPPGASHRNPVSLTIDPIFGRIYWGTQSLSAISVADLNGENPTTIPVPGSLEPYAVEIDSLHQQLYWTTGYLIYRTDLTTLLSELVVTDSTYLCPGLAIDVDGGKLYWTTGQGAKVKRSNLDGSEIETIVTGAGGSRYADIEFDRATHTISWLDNRYFVGDQATYLRRANPDGSNLQTIQSMGWSAGGFTLFVPEPSTGLLFCAMAGSVLLQCAGRNALIRSRASVSFESSGRFGSQLQFNRRVS